MVPDSDMVRPYYTVCKTYSNCALSKDAISIDFESPLLIPNHPIFHILYRLFSERELLVQVRYMLSQIRLSVCL